MACEPAHVPFLRLASTFRGYYNGPSILGYPWSGDESGTTPWRAKFHPYKILEGDPLRIFNLLSRPTIITALMSSQSRERVNPSEDILKQLVNYDVTILMDDSSSMRGGYWRQVWDIFCPPSQELALMVCVSGGGSDEGSGYRSGQVR